MNEQRVRDEASQAPTPLRIVPDDDRALLRVSDIQRLTGLGEGTVRRLLSKPVRSGGIPAVRIEGCVGVRKADFDRWLRLRALDNP